MKIKSTFFFSALIISNALFGQDLNNCVDEILNNQYENILSNISNYDKNILLYGESRQVLIKYENAIDSLEDIIYKADFSKNEQAIITDLIHLAINNISNDVYSQVQGMTVI